MKKIMLSFKFSCQGESLVKASTFVNKFWMIFEWIIQASTEDAIEGHFDFKLFLKKFGDLGKVSSRFYKASWS